ncbi:single-stranded DNA-binding protein [Hathewaya massiliensis]|uniref:single-stranded DNA-binding protein n=1 Tax=Hathewaya massiliensis TaxID=1964382 RepID=UPI00115ACD07|nr:single-stranded DNA-binding protein [Hathewaya massiliensis]
MNKVFLIGRITKDATLKSTTENNKSYTKFPIAVDRDYTQKEGSKSADFFQVTLWGKAAENLVQYLNKGRLISVIGKLRNNNYENKEGEKKYYTEIICEEIKFLEYKKAE